MRERYRKKKQNTTFNLGHVRERSSSSFYQVHSSLTAFLLRRRSFGARQSALAWQRDADGFGTVVRRITAVLSRVGPRRRLLLFHAVRQLGLS